MFPCTFCSIYKNVPNIPSSNILVLLTNFLYTVSSFIWGRFLCKICPLHNFISLHFRSVCDSFCSFLHKGCLLLSIHFLRPMIFKICSLNHDIAFLSLSLHQDVYNSLTHFFFFFQYVLKRFLFSHSLTILICLSILLHLTIIDILLLYPNNFHSAIRIKSQSLYKFPS